MKNFKQNLKNHFVMFLIMTNFLTSAYFSSAAAEPHGINLSCGGKVSVRENGKLRTLLGKMKVNIELNLIGKSACTEAQTINVHGTIKRHPRVCSKLQVEPSHFTILRAGEKIGNSVGKNSTVYIYSDVVIDRYQGTMTSTTRKKKIVNMMFYSEVNTVFIYNLKCQKTGEFVAKKQF